MSSSDLGEQEFQVSEKWYGVVSPEMFICRKLVNILISDGS